MLSLLLPMSSFSSLRSSYPLFLAQSVELMAAPAPHAEDDSLRQSDWAELSCCSCVALLLSCLQTHDQSWLYYCHTCVKGQKLFLLEALSLSWWKVMRCRLTTFSCWGPFQVLVWRDRLVHEAACVSRSKLPQSGSFLLVSQRACQLVCGALLQLSSTLRKGQAGLLDSFICLSCPKWSFWDLLRPLRPTWG